MGLILGCTWDNAPRTDSCQAKSAGQSVPVSWDPTAAHRSGETWADLTGVVSTTSSQGPFGQE